MTRLLGIRLAALGLCGAALAGCGGSSPTGGELSFTVSGLVEGHTASFTAANKAGFLDNSFETVTFKAVGNGTHVLPTKQYGTFKGGCNCPGPTLDAPDGETCRYNIPSGEQSASLSKESPSAGFTCAYTANGFVKVLATGVDGLTADVTFGGSPRTYTYRVVGAVDRGEMALPPGTYQVTCPATGGKTAQAPFELVVLSAAHLTVTCAYQ